MSKKASSGGVSVLVGLRTHDKKYLTLDPSGLHATGSKFSSKQHCKMTEQKDGTWALAFGKGKKFMVADLDVGVTDKIVPEATFKMEYTGGCVSFKLCGPKEKEKKPRYIMATSGKVSVTKDLDQDAALFELTLTIFPQISIKSSKDFIGLMPDGSTCLRKNSFGKDVVFALGRAPTRGCFTLCGSNGKLATAGSRGVIGCTQDYTSKVPDAAQYILKIVAKKGKLKYAFQNIETGQYVVKAGAGIAANKRSVSTVEIIPNCPQITLKAFNGMYVSIDGENIKCDAKKVKGSELFMLEPVEGKGFALKTPADKYVTCQGGGFLARADEVGKTEVFQIEYEGGMVALKGGNGKYVNAAKIGGLKTAGSSRDAKQCLYHMVLENRQAFVLQVPTSKNFVKSLSGTVKCRSIAPEVFHLVYNEKTANYKIRCQETGKYWNVEGKDNNIELGDTSSNDWFVELQNGGHIVAIRDSKSGKYVTFDKTKKTMIVVSDKIGKNEVFQF